MVDYYPAELAAAFESVNGYPASDDDEVGGKILDPEKYIEEHMPDVKSVVQTWQKNGVAERLAKEAANGRRQSAGAA